MSTAAAPVRPWRNIRTAIELPTVTAIWVLAIHALTIVSPVLIVVVAQRNATFLDRVLDYPWLLTASAIALIVASVCESAQNTLDRWYLTGTPRTLLDLFFTWLIVAALSAQAVAAAGTSGWVTTAAILVSVTFPLAYLAGWPIEPFQAVAGLGAAVLLYRALDQPVVFLALLGVFLTLYFLNLLLQTKQQVMHGFTTGVNMLSVVAVALAVVWAAQGSGWSWSTTLAVVAVTLVAALAIRSRLLRLGPTPRPLSEAHDLIVRSSPNGTTQG